MKHVALVIFYYMANSKQIGETKMNKKCSCKNIHKDILGTIGNTPVVELCHLTKKHGLEGRIYAKLDYLNPGLSKKDRIAKYMIEQMEKSGKLKKGQTVIEQTSGNTGISLALVCAIKGYPFVAVMSEGNSIERVMRMKWFGAKVEIVPKVIKDTAGVTSEDYYAVKQRFEELADELGAVKVGQFYNELNPEAHYKTTATEILNQLPDLDAFCDFMGTNGTFAGIAKKLKEKNPSVKCIMVEPSEKSHVIQGGGYNTGDYVFIKNEFSDETINVSSEQAIQWMKELALTEGIAGGISSGASHMVKGQPR